MLKRDKKNLLSLLFALCFFEGAKEKKSFVFFLMLICPFEMFFIISINLTNYEVRSWKYELRSSGL
jgi:hypothetical protein